MSSNYTPACAPSRHQCGVEHIFFRTLYLHLLFSKHLIYAIRFSHIFRFAINYIYICIHLIIYISNLQVIIALSFSGESICCCLSTSLYCPLCCAKCFYIFLYTACKICDDKPCITCTLYLNGTQQVA